MTVDFGAMPTDTMKADGLDDAIIGVDASGDQPVLKYDYSKCVAIFMDQNDWSHEDAVEWMEFNVVGAYVGPGTPTYWYEGCEED